MSYPVPLGSFGSTELEPELLSEHGGEKKRGTGTAILPWTVYRTGEGWDTPSLNPHLKTLISFQGPAFLLPGKNLTSLTHGLLRIFITGPPLSRVWTSYICSLFIVKGFSQMVITPQTTSEVPLLSTPPAGPPETIWGKKAWQERVKLKSVIMHAHAVRRPEPGTVTHPRTDPWTPLRPGPDEKCSPCPGCEMMWDFAEVKGNGSV